MDNLTTMCIPDPGILYYQKVEMPSPVFPLCGIILGSFVLFGLIFVISRSIQCMFAKSFGVGGFIFATCILIPLIIILITYFIVF